MESEIPYRNGKKHGIAKWWDKDGQLEDEEYYIHGEEVTKEEYEKLNQKR